MRQKKQAVGRFAFKYVSGNKSIHICSGKFSIQNEALMLPVFFFMLNSHGLYFEWKKREYFEKLTFNVNAL